MRFCGRMATRSEVLGFRLGVWPTGGASPGNVDLSIPEIHLNNWWLEPSNHRQGPYRREISALCPIQAPPETLALTQSRRTHVDIALIEAAMAALPLMIQCQA